MPTHVDCGTPTCKQKIAQRNTNYLALLLRTIQKTNPGKLEKKQTQIKQSNRE